MREPDALERSETIRNATAEPTARRGVLPALAVLVPSIVVVVAGVFLLTGFGPHALHSRPHLGDGLTMAGVVAAAVAAGAALGDLAWLLITASHDRAPARRQGATPL